MIVGAYNYRGCLHWLKCTKSYQSSIAVRVNCLTFKTRKFQPITAVLPYDESTLLSALTQGDREAFAAIYERYWEELIDFAYKRLRIREEAEEVVQDVFVNLYERRTELNIHTSLKGYLCNAVRFKVYNKYREWLSHGHTEKIGFLEDVAYSVPGTENLEYKELDAHLKHSINKLPEKCREVFLLSREEKLSNKLIAERLGISVSTVEKHIGKALQLLREDLKEYNMDVIIVALVVGIVGGTI